MQSKIKLRNIRFYATQFMSIKLFPSPLIRVDFRYTFRRHISNNVLCKILRNFNITTTVVQGDTIFPKKKIQLEFRFPPIYKFNFNHGYFPPKYNIFDDFTLY